MIASAPTVQLARRWLKKSRDRFDLFIEKNKRDAHKSFDAYTRFSGAISLSGGGQKLQPFVAC
jgi:hypothetical protein